MALVYSTAVQQRETGLHRPRFKVKYMDEYENVFEKDLGN
jgi:hypothetical protein